MTHKCFIELASGYGFTEVYFATPRQFDLGGNRFHLVSDAFESFPFATCIAVLVYPYQPFTVNERIPAYYLASNRAYHAVKELIEKLDAHGIHAEKVDIPVKLQLQSEGIGIKCKNSLIAIPLYGTRMILLALAVSGLTPLSYGGANEVRNSEYCKSCHRCIDACPFGAIDENGLTADKCMRMHMNPAMHPDRIRMCQTTYVGCEICQYACPMNANLSPTVPDEEAVNAFELKKLIRGDAADARGLIGRNLTSNGKLTAEAIAFAARDGLYAEEILQATDSPFEAVRDAVRFANDIWIKKELFDA